jgi:hypothetical protein
MRQDCYENSHAYLGPAIVQTSSALRGEFSQAQRVEAASGPYEPVLRSLTPEELSNPGIRKFPYDSEGFENAPLQYGQDIGLAISTSPNDRRSQLVSALMDGRNERCKASMEGGYELSNSPVSPIATPELPSQFTREGTVIHHERNGEGEADSSNTATAPIIMISDDPFDDSMPGRRRYDEDVIGRGERFGPGIHQQLDHGAQY